MKPIRCKLGFHDWQWHLTVNNHDWEECTRCGTVKAGHAERRAEAIEGLNQQ